MKIIFVLYIIFILTFKVLAQDDYVVSENDVRFDIEMGFSIFLDQSINQKLLPNQCFVETKNSKCQKFYSELFLKDEISVNLAFGFENTNLKDDFAKDKIRKNLVIEKLTSKCDLQSNSNKICDFQRTDDEDVLVKQLRLENGTSKKMTINLKSPMKFKSMSEVYANIDEQNKESEKIKDFFENSIESADIAFYLGHSRIGGGPDFFPPVTDSSGHVNYEYYKTNQGGIDSLLEKLKNRKSRNLKVLGIFSCDSDKHFASKISKIAPELNLITTKRVINHVEGLLGALSSLNSILNGYCQNGIINQMNYNSIKDKSQKPFNFKDGV